MHALFEVPPSNTNRARDDRPRPPRVDPRTLVSGLNEPQLAAVTHAGSPLLIVAGAGSGKTRVLAHRIAYLLAARDVHPGEIIAITFTNKAAGEMRERVETLVSPALDACRFPPSTRPVSDPAGRARARRAEVEASRSTMPTIRGARCNSSRASLISTQRYSARSRRRRLHPERLIDPERPRETRRSGGRSIAGRTRSISGASRSHTLDFDDLIMSTVHLFHSRPWPSAITGGSGMFSSTKIKTPTTRNTCWSRRWWAGTDDLPPAELCVVGDATSRFTRSVARSATSWSSGATIPTRARSCSSRITDRHRRSCHRQRGDRSQH